VTPPVAVLTILPAEEWVTGTLNVIPLRLFFPERSFYLKHLRIRVDYCE